MKFFSLLFLLSSLVFAQHPPSGVTLDMSDWIPYQYNDKKITGSIFDMSHLLEKPAGEHGFLKTDGEYFEFMDGTRARFYGGNIFGEMNFADKKQAELFADRIAKSGANIVRMHHLDVVKPWTDKVVQRSLFGGQMPDSTRQLDPEMLDKFDYMVYCLKERGIYIFLSHISSRFIMQGDHFPADADAFEDVAQGFKVEGMFDPYLINLQKEYLTQLLTHKNPYTGLALKDDPALALTEIINENTLFWLQKDGWFGINSSYYQNMLQAMFAEWLLAKYDNFETVLVKWAQDNRTTFLEDENIFVGKLNIPHIYIKESEWPVSDQRKRDTFQFLLDLQETYYTDMDTFLRKELKLKIPIAGSNHWCNDIADLYINAKLDYVDRHSYWTHPKNEYNYIKGQGIEPKPMVKDGWGGNIGTNAQRRVFGKPFTISEWHNCLPNPYRAEGTPIMAAYSCMQNWHPMHYAYYGVADTKPDTINSFEVAYDPTQANLFPICALMFHRQDFKECTQQYYEIITPSQAADPLAHIERHPQTALVAKYGLAFTDIAVPAQSNARLLKAALESPEGIYRSMTQELYWDQKHGRVFLNSPRTQGIIGFAAGSIITTRDMQFDLKTEFAVVIASSLNDKPIDESEHILISTSADARMTGVEMSTAADMLLTTGTFPFLQQPVEGKIIIKGTQPTVYKLNTNGKRIGKIPTKQLSSGWMFEMKSEHQCMHYELVRK